jgi:hypothetical protein
MSNGARIMRPAPRIHTMIPNLLDSQIEKTLAASSRNQRQ